MFKTIKEWLFGKTPEANTTAAPYKVEAPLDVAIPAAPVPPAPEPVKCGCGRSPTGYCVGLHKLNDADWAVHPDNPVKPAAVVEAAKPAAKPVEAKPVAKKAPAKKKPAAIKAPAKKEVAKKPRAKKTQ